MPWSVLVLLGGSFALAYSVKTSGLAAWGVQQLAGVGALPPLTALLLVSATTILLTAFTSNTATAQLMLELTATAFMQSRTGPLGLLSAVTLSASCDFALPAGTPPNAIVFGSGLVRLPVMARTGVALDLLAAVMVALWCFYGLPHVF
jgi:sodium-dependent dicarboxylate transporter 2/3/5